MLYIQNLSNCTSFSLNQSPGCMGPVRTTRQSPWNFSYYNSNSRVRIRKKSYIRLIQEDLIEFLVQSVYLIYAS